MACRLTLVCLYLVVMALLHRSNRVPTKYVCHGTFSLPRRYISFEPLLPASYIYPCRTFGNLRTCCSSHNCRNNSPVFSCIHQGTRNSTLYGPACPAYRRHPCVETASSETTAREAEQDSGCHLHAATHSNTQMR